MNYLNWQWQYNGCAYWEDIINWCQDNIPQKYHTNGSETIFFENEKYYTMFLLKWT